MRLDKLLFNLRLAKSRALAQRWIGEGHMRVNGHRVAGQDRRVAVGDVLTLPVPGERAVGVLVIQITALPDRRGPASEARQCYRPLDGSGPIALAGEEPR